MPSQNMVEILETTVQSSEQAFLIISGCNILTSFIFAYLLQYLWGMINTLQLMMMTALFSIQPPINTQMFMFALLKFVNFDIYNTEELWNMIFHLKEQGPFNAIFEHGGF